MIIGYFYRNYYKKYLAYPLLTENAFHTNTKPFEITKDHHDKTSMAKFQRNYLRLSAARYSIEIEVVLILLF